MILEVLPLERSREEDFWRFHCEANGCAKFL